MNHDDILKEHIERFTGKTVIELKDSLTKPLAERVADCQTVDKFLNKNRSLTREMIEDFIGIPKRTIVSSIHTYNKNHKGKWR